MFKTVGVAILGTGELGKEVFDFLLQEEGRRFAGVRLFAASVLPDKQGQAFAPRLTVENIAEVIADPSVDIVIDALSDTERAKICALAALHEGKSVVTANAELVAKNFSELERVAKSNRCGVFFSAAGFSGASVMRTVLGGSPAAKIDELGFLSETSDEEKRYALSLLASLAFKRKLSYTEIATEECGFAREDEEIVRSLGYRPARLAFASMRETGTEARISTVLLSQNHPLYAVGGGVAAYWKGEAFGKASAFGETGVKQTACALVSDALYAAERGEVRYELQEKGKRLGGESGRYFRLSLQEDGGKSLLAVTSVLGKSGLNISLLKAEGGRTFFLLDRTDDGKAAALAAKLKALPSVKIEATARTAE